MPLGRMKVLQGQSDRLVVAVVMVEVVVVMV